MHIIKQFVKQKTQQRAVINNNAWVIYIAVIWFLNAL